MDTISKRSICIFCGSNPGKPPEYVETARKVGRSLAERGIRVVYGAGGSGMMGAVADGVIEASGEIVGVMPEFLVNQDRARMDLTELRPVSSMDERKGLMIGLADGFLSLPGGFGTFDEWFEVVTWRQLGLHEKPCALLNINGYFDGLLMMLERAVEDELLRPEHRDLLLVESEIDILLEKLSDAIR